MDEKRVREIVREELIRIQEEAAAETTANECVCCKQQTGNLELENGRFICEDCAQVMSEFGSDMDAT